MNSSVSRDTEETEKHITFFSHLFVGSIITEIDDLSKKYVDPMDFETELLSNKYYCPNGHKLTVTICSCAPTDLLFKKFVFKCKDDCEYNKMIGLDCGNSGCNNYQE